MYLDVWSPDTKEPILSGDGNGCHKTITVVLLELALNLS